MLTEALRKVQYPVIQSAPCDVKPAELLRAAEALQFEGAIAKRKGSLYEPGQRSGAWLKYKINCSQEFVIGGYTLGGNPFDALIVMTVRSLNTLQGESRFRAVHPARPLPAVA